VSPRDLDGDNGKVARYRADGNYRMIVALLIA
jgi:hypothetical protein